MMNGIIPDLRDMFEQQLKFMFVIFKKKAHDNIFKGIKLWNMPISILDNEVKLVWERTREIISSGNIVKYIRHGKNYSNFPDKSFNRVSHVRPHARNLNDRYDLPVRDKLTLLTTYPKHCFWLNNNYVREIIEKDETE